MHKQLLRKILSEKRAMLFFFVLFWGGFSLFVFYHSISYAQNSEEAEDTAGLGISPVVFELNADPGDTLTNQIKVFNTSPSTLSVSIEIDDFAPVGEEGQVVLETPEESNTYSLAAWTIVSPNEFVIAPNGQTTVTFTITVPPNAEPGGHYGSIVAVLSGDQPQATGSTLTSKRGALVLLSVSGKVTESVIIDSFIAPRFQEYGPIDFNLIFRNTGNVHVRPAGFITITDTFGKQVAELEFPSKNVIPEATRSMPVTWNVENLIGNYTATVVASYGSAEKQSLTQVISFVVFPWKTALVIFVVFAVVTFILIKSRKRIKKSLAVLLGK